MLSTFMAFSLLPEQNVLSCAACALASRRLTTVVEEISKAMEKDSVPAESLTTARKRWMRGENAATIRAALDDELDELCVHDDFLASSSLQNACEALRESHDEKLLEAALGGTANTVCALLVHESCTGDDLQSAAASVAVEFFSEAVPEPGSASAVAGPRGTVRRLVRRDFVNRPRNASLLLMLYHSSPDQAPSQEGGTFGARVPPAYVTSVNEFYRLASLTNRSVPLLELGQMDTRFNSPPSGLVLPDPVGVQYALFRHGSSHWRPVSLPLEGQADSSLAGLSSDEVRRRLFELLYGYLTSEQVKVLQQRVVWNLPTELTVTPQGGKEVAADTDARPSSRVSGMHTRGDVLQPCHVCEALVTMTLDRIGRRQRTELEVVGAFDGTCGQAKDMAWARACYGLVEGHGEALEAAVMASGHNVASRNGVSESRALCAAAHVDGCDTAMPPASSHSKATATSATPSDAASSKHTSEAPRVANRGKASKRSSRLKAAVRVEDAQRCEVCSVLLHEVTVARAAELADLRARRPLKLEKGEQARRRREIDERAALSRVVEAKFEDVCEAEAAFHICNDFLEKKAPGQSSLRTPWDHASASYSWAACSAVTLQRCKEVHDEHADVLLHALQRGDHDDASSLAVDTCSTLFAGCNSTRASLHLPLLVEAAAVRQREAQMARERQRDEL